MFQLTPLPEFANNLLTNAVKYSPGKESIHVVVVEKENEILVSVTDSGIGINRVNIDKIFEMYFRENLNSNHAHGLGIGLSISAEIIARHHGRIWAVSELGKGSTFYFTISQKAISEFSIENVNGVQSYD